MRNVDAARKRSKTREPITISSEECRNWDAVEVQRGKYACRCVDTVSRWTGIRIFSSPIRAPFRTPKELFATPIRSVMSAGLRNCHRSSPDWLVEDKGET